MAVAVVAEKIMNPAAISIVCLLKRCVEPLNILDLEFDILVCLTKSKIVHTNVVGPCKVMNHAIRVSNSNVSNTGNNPS